MEYADFIKKKYINHFEGKKGLYLISPKEARHTQLRKFLHRELI